MGKPTKLLTKEAEEVCITCSLSFFWTIIFEILVAIDCASIFKASLLNFFILEVFNFLTGVSSFHNIILHVLVFSR